MFFGRKRDLKGQRVRKEFYSGAIDQIGLVSLEHVHEFHVDQLAISNFFDDGRFQRMRDLRRVGNREDSFAQ